MKYLLIKKIPKVKIIKNGNNKYIITSPYVNIKIPLCVNISPPRDGIFFVEVLKSLNLKNKKVLDIGTGYLGYLGQHTKHFGADKVLSIDIDAKAIKSARTFNNFGKKVQYCVSDVYSKIPKYKFDIIISNPPQLPSKTNDKISDFGGHRGLDVIKKIICGFSDHINKKGALYMLIFDFLLDDIGKLCNSNNLLHSIISCYNKKVRKGGETEQKIKFIEKVYSNYKFKKINNNYYHKVYILKIEKYENHTKSSRSNIKY